MVGVVRPLKPVNPARTRPLPYQERRLLRLIHRNCRCAKRLSDLMSCDGRRQPRRKSS